jgi:hypothetical protein
MNGQGFIFVPPLSPVESGATEPILLIQALLDGCAAGAPLEELQLLGRDLTDAVFFRCQEQEVEMLKRPDFPRERYAKHVADHSTLVRGVINLQASLQSQDARFTSASLVEAFRRLYLRHMETFKDDLADPAEDTGAA